jgi:uncharacterized protein YdeI (YjbR/CyaY-like superfamily)
MGARDPRIDAYIAKAEPFAKPILTHLREVVHEGCPHVEETLKWGMPSFMYRGILCGMASFKEHCVFGFWKGTLIVTDKGKSLEAMGSFGRITKLSDLPSRRALIGYIKQAMKLNEDGVKAPKKRTSGPKKPLRVPTYLANELQKHKKAQAIFEAFSPSHKKEYIEWLTEAKTEETRKRRLHTAIEWMAEGKPRNWKYMKK